MNYSNLPVYIKREDKNTPPSSIPFNYVPAQNVSVEYQAQNDADRKLGIDIDAANQFSNSAPLQAKINFNSYINSETSGALTAILESSGENSCRIRVGNNVYRNCFLDNYDVNVEPFRPASISASYTVYNAPKINRNQLQTIPVTTEGSRNELLYSESLTGDNYIYTNLVTTFNQPDATGGFAATLISGQDAEINIVSYTLENEATYSWQSITGAGGGISLPALLSEDDVSVDVSFSDSKTFIVGSTVYSKVWISNNGIISFDASDTGFASSQSDDFPISPSTRKFIAAYWRKMAADTGGDILYKQESDRFIIEYAAVNALIDAEPQTYQIILFFNTGNIEIRYNSVSASGVFVPNPNIGIQWSDEEFIDYDSELNQFINYEFAEVDTTKSLRFVRSSVGELINPNFVYRKAITPDLLRTFSIYLKRFVGSGNIKYTLDGGVNWEIVNPPLTTDWLRYVFPATKASQQIGIEVETIGDAIFVYGAQLEPLGYATDYIPTLGEVGVREPTTEEVPVDFIFPQVDLSNEFANTMVNGDNCSVSSTTGFVSNIQTSIRYSVNCTRTPIYNIGTTNANEHILDTVEKQMDISSTNLTSFIDFSGSKLASDLNLTLKNSQNSFSSIISMKSGANIFSQQTNAQEGDSLVTQVSIKEIIV